MTAVPILRGIYTDGGPDFRSSLPRNMVPVAKASGISQGYLRPADGITTFCTGPGTDRGGINWDGEHYRVMGDNLVRIAEDGTVTTIGTVGAGGQASLDYSFDRLGVAAGGGLHLYDGANLVRVTDGDIGNVIDAVWVAGYWLTTDGEFLVVTDLDNPFSVNPLKYGSAESDPDPVKAVDELRNEVYALGRYTIQPFQNVGGTGFPFAVIEGGLVPRGVIGTHAYAQYLGTFAFLGSGRNEAPAVYLMLAGDTDKLSTDEVDRILAGYTEAELAETVVEARTFNGLQHLLVHLPDQTLAYDHATSKAVGELAWFTLTSSIVGTGTYRARNLVRCYDRWYAGDPTSAKVGILDDTLSTHHGETTGWEFGTLILYQGGNGAIVHELELVPLAGRVSLGADPVVWTSYSLDGQTWSQERPTSAGKQGDRLKRIAWRQQGRMPHWRVQRFRGTSDAHVAFARLEAQFELLQTRPAYG